MSQNLYGKCFGGPKNGERLVHDYQTYEVAIMPDSLWRSMSEADPMEVIRIKRGIYRYTRLSMFREMVGIWLYWGEMPYTGHDSDAPGWMDFRHALRGVFL